jgi:hypothetical protein
VREVIVVDSEVPRTGRYFQVGEAERATTRLMDGIRTVEETRLALAVSAVRPYDRAYPIASMAAPAI